MANEENGHGCDQRGNERPRIEPSNENDRRYDLEEALNGDSRYAWRRHTKAYSYLDKIEECPRQVLVDDDDILGESIENTTLEYNGVSMVNRWAYQTKYRTCGIQVEESNWTSNQSC